MISEGLQRALWNSTTLSKLEMFSFLRQNNTGETHRVAQGKELLKELQNSNVSSGDLLYKARWIMAQIAYMATEPFHEVTNGPQGLQVASDTVRQNLDSYMKSVEMNQKFYL